MGLLSRANNLDEIKSNPGISFSDFIIKHSLKTCALLEKKDSDYKVSDSIGFDAESILSATSTSDFWDGICKSSSQIYTFSNSDNRQLLQLFSFNMKDNLKDLSVYKNSAGKIIICAGSLSQAAAKDFESINTQRHNNNILNLNPLIKENTVVLLLKIDFSEAIKSFYISEKDKITDLEFFTKTLMNELYNRFTCRYNIPDTTLQINPFVLKSVFITDKEYSLELISHHIILNLKEVLNNHTDYIQICFAGTADSCDKIQSFLQAE